MSLASWSLGFALASSLVLPPPATESRSRAFCGEWLRLSEGAKEDVLQHAARRDAGSPAEARCQTARRAGLRFRLDVECGNWSQLMDFEVRAVVEGVVRSCQSARDAD